MNEANEKVEQEVKETKPSMTIGEFFNMFRGGHHQNIFVQVNIKNNCLYANSYSSLMSHRDDVEDILPIVFSNFDIYSEAAGSTVTITFYLDNNDDD